ncbi:MAG: TetR/AcrR family transcriptional regulator [Solobacterium sp.]|nr:TetR/AcrR family transcriptional regulator [Solobacterium sp.]
MRPNGEKDLRVRRTLESIRRAFEQLLLEKDYEKITVTELAERAMINKKTFYAYYRDLDDLLMEIQDELSQEFAQRTKDYTFRDIDKLTREFFLFSEEKGAFYEKITCNDTIIRGRMIRSVTKSVDRGYDQLKQFTDDEKKLIQTFSNSTTLSMYKQWIEDGKKVPVERVIEITTVLLQKGLSGITGVKF